MSSSRLPLLSAAACGLALGAAAAAQPSGEVGEYSDATIEASVLEPRKLEVTEDAELASLIRAPEGFTVEVFARDLVNPDHARRLGAALDRARPRLHRP